MITWNIPVGMFWGQGVEIEIKTWSTLQAVAGESDSFWDA